MERLRLATPDEKLARDRLTHAAWGERLTVEAYVAREERLRSHPFARARMETWLWEDDGRVLASCETFRVGSVLHGVAGDVFSVASVFVEPALRGKRHADAMMRALVATLRARTNVHGSLLFSDVGERPYAGAGYVAVRPRPDRVVDPVRFAAETAPGILRFGDAAVSSQLGACAPPAGDWVVVSGAGQLDWHLERERAYAALLGRSRLAACGARLGASRIFFAADHKNDRLVVLLLDVHDAAAIAPLLGEASRVAGEAGLSEVRCWDVGPLPGPWPDGALPIARDGSLPMLSAFVPAAERALARGALGPIPRSLWV